MISQRSERKDFSSRGVKGKFRKFSDSVAERFFRIKLLAFFDEKFIKVKLTTKVDSKWILRQVEYPEASMELEWLEEDLTVRFLLRSCQAKMTTGRISEKNVNSR